VQLNKPWETRTVTGQTKTTLRQSTALTATRTSNLPAAIVTLLVLSSFTLTARLVRLLAFGRTFSRAGSDTLNSGTAAVTVAVGGGTARFETNGTSNWTQLDTHNSILALQDGTDPSKQVTFDLSNITTGTTRTLNVPNANSTTAQTKAATTNEFLTAMSAQGVFTSAQLMEWFSVMWPRLQTIPSQLPTTSSTALVELSLSRYPLPLVSQVRSINSKIAVLVLLR
jgi:hypothetical protein